MDAVAKAVDACQRGDVAAIEALLDEGLSASTIDTEGCSLLHWSAINNRVAIVQRLLALGADPNAIGGILQSTPLHWAARVGSMASCVILIKAGAHCNVRDNQGYSPIHLAVQGHHLNLVAYLLEKFDYAVNITDNSGMTPVMWAAYRSFSLFPMRLFLRKNADLNAKEHLQENTALHLAAQERNVIAIRELVNAGADIFVKNKQQETALDIARNQREQKIIDTLEEGARKQGMMKARCCSFFRTRRMRRVFEFIFPMTFLIFFGVLFHFVHYAISSALLLGAVVFLAFTVKVNMHGGTESSLIPVGVTLSEASIMTIMWTLQVHWFAPWYLQIAFIVSMTTLLATFAVLFFGDPGVITPNPSNSDFVEEVESLPSKISYCFSCWVDRPNGSKHCSTCDRCVRDFDHHCPWLHQCVTKRNLRAFLLFVFCVGMCSILYTAAGIRLFALSLRDHGINYTLEHFTYLMLTLFISIMHACMMSALFIQQLIQISAGVTTHDRIMAGRRGAAASSALPTTTPASESTTTGGDLHYRPPPEGWTYQPPTCSDRLSNICHFIAGHHLR